MTEDTKHKVDITTLVLRWALGVVATLVVGFLLGTNSRVDEVDLRVDEVGTRVGSIELWRAERKANEWNLSMQMDHERSANVKFEEIREEAVVNQKFIVGQLAAIRIAIARLPDEIPPEEWVSYVKERLDNADDRIDKTDLRIDAIEHSGGLR